MSNQGTYPGTYNTRQEIEDWVKGLLNGGYTNGSSAGYIKSKDNKVDVTFSQNNSESTSDTIAEIEVTISSNINGKLLGRKSFRNDINSLDDIVNYIMQ